MVTDVSGQAIGHHLPVSSTHQSWNALTFKMEQILSPETALTNYHQTLRNISQEVRQPQLRRKRAMSQYAAFFRQNKKKT
jgi:hypothetical protein